MKAELFDRAFLIVLAVVIAAMTCLTGCTPEGGNSGPTDPGSRESAAGTEAPVVRNHYFSTAQYTNENLGEIADQIRQSQEVPPEYVAETSEDIRGTVETVTYSTRAYAYEEYFAGELNGRELPVEKTMYVYLPHGYTEEKQYPVLYLLHGGHEIAEYWFSMETEKDDEGPVGEGVVVRMLDNMIALGVIEPMIVVTPGIYVETNGYHAYPEGDLDQRHLTDRTENDPATVCSNKNTVWTDNFATELRNDIIPLIDEKYSTYADREHRGIAGTSMGGMTTLRAGLWRCNDLFAWYAPMSSGVTAEENETVIKELTDALWASAAPEGEDPEISMLLNFNGYKDMSKGPHLTCMSYLLEQSGGALVDGENYAFFIIDPFEHNFDAWRYTLCLTLQVFFKS